MSSTREYWRRIIQRHATNSLRAEEGLAGERLTVRPARIVVVDVDAIVPDLSSEGQFLDAWIILCYRDAPRAIVVLDLGAGNEANQSRLQEEYSKIRASLRDEPVFTISPSNLPRLSVVVPTIATHFDQLSKCVESLGRLDYPDYEVLLIDNRRAIPVPDPLCNLTRDRPWLRIIRESRPGISAARNRGIRESRADFIAFTDDDVRVDRHWLRALATRLALEPVLDAVTGLVLPDELETPAQIWFERYFGGFGGLRSFRRVTLALNSTERRLACPGRMNELDAKHRVMRRSSIYGVGRYVAGANMLFRRTALDRIHGFDVALGTGTASRGGEDLAALISVLWSGGRVGYEPSAFVFHRHRREYAELLTQLDGSGIGFTAMLSSLVRRDPRHLVALFAQLPRAATRLAYQSVQRARGKPMSEHGFMNKSPAHSYPSRMFFREFSAYLGGPVAYARSVVESKRS
ncbi:MAG: glycosyltransferase family 2 protein [Acidimicrobiales bacterium]